MLPICSIRFFPSHQGKALRHTSVGRCPEIRLHGKPYCEVGHKATGRNLEIRLYEEIPCGAGHEATGRSPEIHQRRATPYVRCTKNKAL